MNPDDLLCPGCDSELSAMLAPDGVAIVSLIHDDTCPIWNNPQTRGLFQKKVEQTTGRRAHAHLNIDTGQVSRVPDTFRP